MFTRLEGLDRILGVKFISRQYEDDVDVGVLEDVVGVSGVCRDGEFGGTVVGCLEGDVADGVGGEEVREELEGGKVYDLRRYDVLLWCSVLT